VHSRQLHGAGQDHPFVLAGEGMRKVDDALDFVVNLLSFAGSGSPQKLPHPHHQILAFACPSLYGYNVA
jgi:hypothetical protein